MIRCYFLNKYHLLKVDYIMLQEHHIEMREKLGIHIYFLGFKSMNKPIIIIICYIRKIISIEYVLIVFPLMINIRMSYVWIIICIWYNLKHFFIELNLHLCGLLCYNIFIHRLLRVRHRKMILHHTNI